MEHINAYIRRQERQGECKSENINFNFNECSNNKRKTFILKHFIV